MLLIHIEARMGVKVARLFWPDFSAERKYMRERKKHLGAKGVTMESLENSLGMVWYVEHTDGSVGVYSYIELEPA